MWLIIGSMTDAAVLWVYQGLLRNGLAPIYFIPIESLGFGSRWEHRLDGSGGSTKLSLADGRVIDSRQVRGTVNRVLSPSYSECSAIEEGDRGYVCQEVFALYASWLKSLPAPILNPPDPQGLCGKWRHPSEWIWLASRAGLPVPNYRFGSKENARSDPKDNKTAEQRVTSAVVLQDKVFGVDLPPELVDGCIRLAEIAGLQTLGIDFTYEDKDGWLFATASPMPDFRLGGWPLLQKLTTILAAEGGDL